jgi:hypothetical protein
MPWNACTARRPSGAVTVVEVENRSPAPFTRRWWCTVAEDRVELDGATLRRAEVVLACRAPGAWARRPSTREIVMSGARVTGPFEPCADRSRSLCSSRLRTERRGAPRSRCTARRPCAPERDAVARWLGSQLERGMQAAIRTPLGAIVDAARADLLLAPARDGGRRRSKTGASTPKRPTVGPHRLGRPRRARKRTAARRRGRDDRAIEPLPSPRFLATCARVLVRDDREWVDSARLPPDWLGQSLTVDRRAVARACFRSRCGGTDRARRCCGTRRRHRAANPGARSRVVVDRICR